MNHPSRRLDDAVHQRTRLGILAVLCEAGRADFNYLRETLELTDGSRATSADSKRRATCGWKRSSKAAARAPG